MEQEVLDMMKITNILIIVLIVCTLAAIGLMIYLMLKRRNNDEGGPRIVFHPRRKKLYGDDIVAYVIQNPETGRSAVIQVDQYDEKPAKVNVEEGDHDLKPTRLT